MLIPSHLFPYLTLTWTFPFWTSIHQTQFYIIKKKENRYFLFNTKTLKMLKDNCVCFSCRVPSTLFYSLDSPSFQTLCSWVPRTHKEQSSKFCPNQHTVWLGQPLLCVDNQTVNMPPPCYCFFSNHVILLA